MIVVDSSGWIEFFTDGPLADQYASRLRKLTAVVTPVIVTREAPARPSAPATTATVGRHARTPRRLLQSCRRTAIPTG